jgi:hypothetical protein
MMLLNCGHCLCSECLNLYTKCKVYSCQQQIDKSKTKVLNFTNSQLISSLSKDRNRSYKIQITIKVADNHLKSVE